jgi:hypothetical protein
MTPLDNLNSQAARFHALFAGLTRAYGTYTVPQVAVPDENGKTKGTARTVFGDVTTAMYDGHLAGKSGLGIVPIRDDSTCSFGAIDIDVYMDIDHAAIAHGLAELNLPLTPCRSKSGGCHVYIFTKVPVPAARLRSYLTGIASLIGHGKAEIFPKQSFLSPDPESAGSWINLPYHAAESGTRYAIAPDGHAMSLAEFLDHAERSKVALDVLSQPIRQSSDFEDGPPCLQSIAAAGGLSDGRKRGLFAMGVYLRKAHPDEYGPMLEQFNDKYMHPRLPAEQLVSIKKSVGGKKYNYVCGDDPLVSRCNAAVCRFRKYGIGGDSTPMAQLGPLKKIETSPPSYIWEIDGKAVPLSVDEILTYRAFRRAAFERTNKLLPLMKEAKWPEILNPAIAEMEIVPMPEDASPDGQLFEQLKAFCNGSWQALKLEEVTFGKPYKEATFYYFTLAGFMGFLGRKHIKIPPVQEIAASVRRRGGRHKVKKLRGQTVNLWTIPAEGIESVGDQSLSVPDSITNDNAQY